MSKKPLTEDKVALWPEYLKMWTQTGLITEPIQLEMAVQALGEAYRCAGKEAPRLVISVDSPLRGVIVSYFLTNSWAKLRPVVLTRFIQKHPDAIKLSKKQLTIDEDWWGTFEQPLKVKDSGLGFYVTTAQQLVTYLVDMLANRYRYLKKEGVVTQAELLKVLPEDVGASLASEVKEKPKEKFWADVVTETNDSWPAISDQLWASVPSDSFQKVRVYLTQVDEGLWAPVQNEIWEKLVNIEQEGKSVKGVIPTFNDLWAEIHKCGYGSQDADWLAFYAFFSMEIGLKCGKQLSGLRSIIQQCGWWWPFENAVIVSNRPKEIHYDSQNRLHRENAPAIAYGDGFGVYSWKGRRVEKRIIMEPVTVEMIDSESNAENRRIFVERYGATKYVQDSNLDPLHSDDWGTLYMKPQNDDTPIYVVKVVCPTTGREYYLGVDPEAYNGRAGKEARAAVASTWRTVKDNTLVFPTPEDYNPGLQT